MKPPFSLPLNVKNVIACFAPSAGNLKFDVIRIKDEGIAIGCGSILIWAPENACRDHPPKLGDNSSACSTHAEYLPKGLASRKHHTLWASVPV